MLAPQSSTQKEEKVSTLKCSSSGNVVQVGAQKNSSKSGDEMVVVMMMMMMTCPSAKRLTLTQLHCKSSRVSL